MNSPLNTIGCQRISTTRTLEEQTRNYTRQSATIVPGLVQCTTYSEHTAYRGNLTGQAAQKKMNPAYINEADLDVDEDMDEDNVASLQR